MQQASNVKAGIAYDDLRAIHGSLLSRMAQH